jgi:hypothetical protein
MSPVGCAKGIIHEQVGLGSQLFSEEGVILRLLLVETDILQDENLPWITTVHLETEKGKKEAITNEPDRLLCEAQF